MDVVVRALELSRYASPSLFRLPPFVRLYATLSTDTVKH